MQQHPVPQNVTQYQFRLVGDMTLKQFLELLGGLAVAYLFFSSNLIFIIKYPLAALSLLGGAALAFFPIEDRPLDQWVINFIKSIYSPTRYIWKKSNKVPNIFTFEAHPIEEVQVSTKTVKAPSISSITSPKAISVTDEERQRINVLDAMLAKNAPTTPTPIPTQIVVDKPTVKPRKLKPFSEVKSHTIFESAARPTPTPQVQKISLSDNDLTTPTTTPIQVPQEKILEKPQTITSENVFVANPSITTEKPATPTTIPANIRLPAAPSSPNLVVGMVVDKEGKIVENAIVQIMNKDGVPARAMKTNSLGQFYTSTPLSSGIYGLEVEREGLTFPINKLEVSGSIISPILLKAS